MLATGRRSRFICSNAPKLERRDDDPGVAKRARIVRFSASYTPHPSFISEDIAYVATRH